MENPEIKRRLLIINAVKITRKKKIRQSMHIPGDKKTAGLIRIKKPPQETRR